ncbi:MAG: hypothetical protein ACREPL_15235 [Rhodanobacteraceae bacterium]
MNETYLTTEQLSERIHYDCRTIRNCLKDSVLLEGVHYIRPFGRRKLLFLWEAIERDIGQYSTTNGDADRTALTPEAVADPTRTAQPVHLRKTRTAPRRAVTSSAVPMAAGGACHV